MRKKPLEICLYVAGAGAFGVFLRWLENQLAFNELNLADPSAFHVMVPGFILVCAAVYWRFILQMQKQNLKLSEEVGAALGSEVPLHRILRIAAGAVMILGALLLFAKSETEKYSGMLRVLAGFALLSGFCFPLMLREAEREQARKPLLCLLTLPPLLCYAVWLILSYRSNSINSVGLTYWLDMLTAIAAMVAYFRLAGFAFDAAQPWRCLFWCMFSGMLCLTSLADERQFGREIMLLASAGQMLLCTWILVQNLQQGERKVVVRKDDGFEHL